MSSRSFYMVAVGSFLVLLILGLVGLVVIKSAEESRNALPILGDVPQFDSVNQDGAQFGLSQLKGHLSVIDFIFTTCPGVCPTMSSNMAGIYHELGAVPRLQFVSISVDPERDSLEVLRRYGKEFGVDDNRWVFLWMPLDDVIKLSESGFSLAADNLPMGHSTRFVLVDDQGRIRGYYDGTDDASMDKLTEDIKRLSRTT